MKVNVSIDDVSPHPLSSPAVLEKCSRLIEKFPDIKFTVFVPVSYWRTMREGTKTTRPLSIDEHPDFCDKLRSLTSNFEVGYHGLYHGIPGISDNDEFQSLTFDEAMSRFNVMKSVVNAAGLTDVFRPIFRPPAWRMSPGSIQAARASGFEVLALSSKEYALKTYAGEETKRNDVIFYNCCPPFDALHPYDRTTIVYHACEWDKNYLSDDAVNALEQWLTSQVDVEYAFMRDML